MNRQLRNPTFKKWIFVILDIIFAPVAFAIAELIKYESLFEIKVSWHDNFFIFSAVLMIVCLSLLMGIYKNITRDPTLPEVLRISGLYSLISVVFSFFAYYDLFGDKIKVSFVVLFMMIHLGISIITKFFSRLNLAIQNIFLVRSIMSESGQNVSRQFTLALVVGGGQAGSRVVRQYIENPSFGIAPVAIIDENKKLWNERIYGVKVVGGWDSIVSTCEKYHIKMIIIAMPSAKRSTIKEIYNICAATGLDVKILPQLMDFTQMNRIGRLEIQDIDIGDLLGRDQVTLNRDLVDTYIKGKVVLVTGGAGSIGSELCRQVLYFGCKKLLIFDICENGLFDMQAELLKTYPEGRIEFLLGSIRDKSRLKNIFDTYEPSVVFHAAAHKHVPMVEYNPIEAVKNNIFGTLNVINQCVDSKVKRFILISTDKAVNPANVMGATKRVAEMLVQSIGKAGGVQMGAVRFGNVMGSTGSVIPTFIRQIKEGGPVTVTHKDIKRYFMTIPEAVQLVLQAGALADDSEIFVLDMGMPIKIYDLAVELIRLCGLKPGVDIDIAFTGLRPGEKMFEELRLDNETVDATSHESIFICKTCGQDSRYISECLDRLKNYVNAEDETAVINELFAIVPNEYRETPSAV